MGRDRIVHPQAQTVVDVGRGIALPVRAFHWMVGGIVQEGLRSLLPGLGNVLAPLVVAVGIDFVVGRGLAHELVQLVVDVDMGALVCLLNVLMSAVPGGRAYPAYWGCPAWWMHQQLVDNEIK